MMNLQKQLPRLIRELQRQGYSHQVIADRSGLSKYVIWKLANGERTRIETAEKFIKWLAVETGTYSSERSLSIPSAATPNIVEGSIAYTEQWDASTNDRSLVPYRQERSQIPSTPAVYSGPSRYLRSPQTYYRDVQRERANRYATARMPKPEPSPVEPAWAQICYGLSTVFSFED